MLFGLIAGLLLDLSPLKAAILPIAMLMVYPMLVNFRPVEAVNFRHGRALGFAMALDFALIPVAGGCPPEPSSPTTPGLFVDMILARLFHTSDVTISGPASPRGTWPQRSR